jgi:hypothetical protein
MKTQDPDPDSLEMLDPQHRGWLWFLLEYGTVFGFISSTLVKKVRSTKGKFTGLVYISCRPGLRLFVGNINFKSYNYQLPYLFTIFNLRVGSSREA